MCFFQSKHNMRPENAEHKHLISTDSVASHPPAAPTEAQPEDQTWFEDVCDTLSSDDRACLDKYLNNANISEADMELTPTVMITNESSSGGPEDSLMAEIELDNNNLIGDVMGMAPFEEMDGIQEIRSDEVGNVEESSVIDAKNVPSPSLKIDAETSDIGHCKISFTTTKNCKKSDSHNYYHVARDIGILKLGLKFTDIQILGLDYIIRAVLIRKNEELKHFPGYFLPSQKTRCTKLQGGPNFPNFSEHHLPPAQS